MKNNCDEQLCEIMLLIETCIYNNEIYKNDIYPDSVIGHMAGLHRAIAKWITNEWAKLFEFYFNLTMWVV